VNRGHRLRAAGYRRAWCEAEQGPVPWRGLAPYDIGGPDDMPWSRITAEDGQPVRWRVYTGRHAQNGEPLVAWGRCDNVDEAIAAAARYLEAP